MQLEVLDFGGNGSPVLLLPGLGATAHSYDELAPLLARQHRVVAMTRRGTGYSSKPDFGFDTPRLAQDVLQVMDAMQLQKVLLVGHSIAGDELTWLGGHHPERFTGLVYLDAAYDRSRRSRCAEPRCGCASSPASCRRNRPSRPQALLELRRDDAAAGSSAVTCGCPEGELIAFLRMDDPTLAGSPTSMARTQQAIAAAIEAPDYAAVKIPALAIYAVRGSRRATAAVV